MIEDFFHLLRITQQIFEKIRNGPNGILRCLRETDTWKNLKSNISKHCPSKFTHSSLQSLPQSIQGARLSLQSLPPPLWFQGGGHTRLRESRGGGGSQFDCSRYSIISLTVFTVVVWFTHHDLWCLFMFWEKHIFKIWTIIILNFCQATSWN